MRTLGALRRIAGPFAWPFAGSSPGLSIFTAMVDVAAAGCAALAVATMHPQAHAWYKLVLLIGLAVAFEEAASRAARLQLRLSADLKRDMTSVWCVAGAVALPAGLAVLLLGAVLGYVWFRQQRPAGQLFNRKLFNAATAVLGCLAAGAAYHAAVGAWEALPWALAGSLPIFAAILVHTLVNRVLVTAALLLMDVRGASLLASRDDNLVELATLCLGGLVAMAALHQIWLTVLVLVPMISLQRGALVRELETAATTDSKTGLLNAVAWEQVARRELSRAQREATPLAVLIVDIDRFKNVNDRFGHMVGDVVLRGVGRVLSREVREYDTVGRFGGEEFVAVLPSAGEVDALVIAERLRARVNEVRVSNLVDAPVAGPDDALAVSIGVACAPVDGDALPDLLVAADAALYQAKAGGRNRVVLADRGAGEDTQALTA